MMEMEIIYFVTCETLDLENDEVKDWFECYSSDDCNDAIRWAEEHVEDYVASEDEQLMVLAVEDGQLYTNYNGHEIVWCSKG